MKNEEIRGETPEEPEITNPEYIYTHEMMQRNGDLADRIAEMLLPAETYSTAQDTINKIILEEIEARKKLIEKTGVKINLKLVSEGIGSFVREKFREKYNIRPKVDFHNPPELW